VKPLAYILAEIDIKDQDGYTKEFLPKVQANVEEFGDKYLGGGYTKAFGVNGSPLYSLCPLCGPNEDYRH